MIENEKYYCCPKGCVYCAKLKNWRKAKGKPGNMYRCGICGKIFTLQELEKEESWQENICREELR